VSASVSLRADARYVLTAQGREDLVYAQRCECSQLFVSDGVYACPHCETIYGVVYGWTIAPRKLRRRTAGPSA
jgi:hypothetical protein